MAEITGGELLMKTLAGLKVEYIFSIPDGGYHTAFKWAKDNPEAGIKMVTPRHEAAGAHMADAYFRVTGKPGVVMAGAGPGTANVISGVITAYAEEMPMLAITTTRKASIVYPERGGMQTIDQRGMFKPVTKFSAPCTDWNRIPELVSFAYRTAVSGVPGPAHIDIPENLTYVKGEESSAIIPDPGFDLNLPQPMGNPEAVRQAAKLLVETPNAQIHAGTAVVNRGAWPELIELAEYLQLPVTSTVGARGAIPEDHPLSVYPVCLPCRGVLSQSPLVLALGCRFGELDFYGKPPLWGLPGKQKIIQVHIDAGRINRNRQVDLAILGDVKIVLGQLLEEVKALTPKRDTPQRIKDLQMFQASWRQGMDKQGNSDQSPILTARMITEVRKFFPRESVSVMDGGNTSLWNVFFNPVLAPRTMVWTSSFGHLGTGLPYAIGAKLGKPDVPVYLITGDSAFGFNIQELETARRLCLPIVCVVNVDQAWGMEKTSMDRALGTQGCWINCIHEPVRYDKVAEAFGCHGEYVTEPGEIAPALKRAADSGLPAVLHVEVDRDANVNPPGNDLWGASHAETA